MSTYLGLREEMHPAPTSAGKIQSHVKNCSAVASMVAKKHSAMLSTPQCNMPQKVCFKAGMQNIFLRLKCQLVTCV